MFQRLWQLSAGWDDPLPEIMQVKWNSCYEELRCIKAVSVPRIIARDFRDKETEKVLQIFCAARPKAHGAFAYAACKFPQRTIGISLIMAKAIVASLKHHSLAWLELIGALIGARLRHYITKTLDFQNVFSIFCTDSIIARYWNKLNNARWKPFVTNRVKNLQVLTDPKNWRRCPELDNAAHRITCSIRPSALLENEL